MAKQHSIFINMSWSFMAQVFSQAAGIIISTILARLLSPDDYGTLALTQVFITLADVFVVSGVGVSLIQDQSATKDDFSTAFFMSLTVGCVLWTVMFICAPYIASYYKNCELILYIRVLSIKLPVASIYTILYAIIAKRMDFGKIFWATIGGSVISGLIGITLAVYGFGIWALIWQALASQIISTLILAFVVRWCPAWSFSWEKAKSYFSYCIKVTGAELLSSLIAQLQTLMIGKKYTNADLAFFNQGQKYPGMLASDVTGSLSAVMFPAIANETDDMFNVKKLMQNSVRISSFLVTPMMAGLAAISKTIVSLVLTDKWLPCVPYMQIACFVNLFSSINPINYQAIKAIGKGGTFFRMQIVKVGINIVLLILALPHGVLAVALSGMISTICACIVNVYPTGKYVGYGLGSQLRDMLPSVLYAIPMVVVVLTIKQVYQGNLLVLLVLQIFSGFSVYIGIAAIFRSSSLLYFFGKMKTFLKGAHLK
ncbi:lipopolysaccharide biosynthesis protein [Oscillibacter sp.]|jgi:O-antigen/teichoic acid export membrane protein|uniref:lipopolysaccharide biosynthesis protein n=1 Tax=Oscillibacter sp. TaxID=1945593 RepID=UPI00216B7741|nr:lipopolysaccharide biosynthesis protein [Oscillibacter sp.]MCI9648360.1 lipopolysaccharide biosynthesis protein [Oscillibacter sp.]